MEVFFGGLNINPAHRVIDVLMIKSTGDIQRRHLY